MAILITILLVVPLAYLAGSMPSAYLVTRAASGEDIRAVGSGNPGAVNVFRQVGPAAGVLVLAADGLKGALMVLAVRAAGLPDYALFAGAMAVVIGHNWPAFLGFRGGKGVAAVFGISLAVLPVATLLGLGAAVAVGLIARNVVIGIAAGLVTVNVLTVATGQSAVQIAMCLTLSALVAATHYAVSYRQVLESVRARGARGLFIPE